ncbi:MAG TPA: TIGR02266 family protein, partial [Minicystis sp.]|nr:TIGR02266 family protein [Minicystis sp.]
MAQDTRKDPRAKVLSMTVRYKSATVDEFIEHHSHDVSRGGIFIKTPSPFPPGTLLKFEIRIQDEQSVLAGVGRVVWKREPAEAGGETPAGMGVKFIKIDDKSKALISRLVDAQGGGTSAFESGKPSNGQEQPAPAAAPASTGGAAAAKKEESKTTPKRASTILGLGTIGSDAKKKEEPAPAKSDNATLQGGFFPKTEPEKEMPPPEERTVMKQAAELLKQALAEAGGSMEDIGTAKPAEEKAAAEAKPAAAEKAAEPPAEEPKAAEAAAPAVVAAAAAAEEPVAEKKAKSEPPAAKVKSEPPPAKEAEKPRPKARPEPVAAKPAAKAPLQPQEESSGSGRVLMILLALAVVGGGA